MNAGLSASIQARLSSRAKARGEDFHAVLIQFGIERFLFRLSRSSMQDRLVLKGALLFDLWFDVPHRPTRDADFLGLGAIDETSLQAVLREACAIPVEDGMIFDADSIRIGQIREEARYGGLRATLQGRLGRARCPVQIDVGYGDVVTPGPDEAIYPTLLDDLPPPRLRVYPRQTVVAEKLEAIVSLGMTNSRMKDYFDLCALAHEGEVDPGMLAHAIGATFARRHTPLPLELPIGLTDEFAQDRVKRLQWEGFLAKNRLQAPSLEIVVREVRALVEAPLDAACKLQGRA